MNEKKSVYETLRAINVSDHTEKKNGLTYLSWAWAWDTLMKYYPTAQSVVHRDPNGRYWFDDGRTGWVEVDVIVEGITRSELFPIMDYKNNSIPADKITTRMASDSVQRALTKAIARHGLGLYVYAGEDLPPEEEDTKEEPKAPQKAQNQPRKKNTVPSKPAPDPDGELTEAQSKMLQNLVKKYPMDGTDLIRWYCKDRKIPDGVKLTGVQAAEVLQMFYARGMR